MTTPYVFPPFGLTLRCGELVLAGTSPDHVPDLIAEAKLGVYDGACPFPFDWPSLPDQDANQWQHCWQTWGTMTPEHFTLKTSVLLDGRAIGCQDVFARTGWATTRTVETGSWIGVRHQGRGIGTLMRQMIAMFCFDHLGMVRLESAYQLGNEASAAVSRKVGYRTNGVRFEANGDAASTLQYMLLEPSDLVRLDEPLEVEGVEGFRRFIGLD